MNERRYLIEVLLRARDSLSQNMRNAARAVDEFTKAEKRAGEESKRVEAATHQQITALEQMREARIREKRGLDDAVAARRREAEGMQRAASAYRDQARQVRSSADELRKQRAESSRAAAGYLEEANSLLNLAQRRQDDIGKIDKTVEALRRQAAGARRMADENRRVARSYDQAITAADKSASAFDKDATARERSARASERAATANVRSSSSASRSIANLERDIARLGSSTGSSGDQLTRYGRLLERVGVHSQGARSSLRGLNSELQGLQLAVVVKYAQSLITALIGLAGQLFAVAAAAGQAAAGISGALAAGAAQAVPVIGVLAAAFGRLTDVLKAVKQQNQQQLTATHDAAAATNRQRAATDQIRSAEQRVADAHRNTARAVQQLTQTRSDAAREEIRAQRDVDQARKDAIRTVQDLKDAELDAIQTLEGARQTQRQAIASGDVLGAAQAQIGVERARRGVTRAREDAAPVRARGVEGVQGVIDAEQRLADVRRQNARQVADSQVQVSNAQRDEQRSTEDLARTRQTATENLAQETAAADKLTDMLRRLTPAERDLYRRVLALQETYRRVARPITDILTRAFSGVIERVNQLLQDPRILGGFRRIATQIAASIRTATREAGGQRSVGVFQILSNEAARNIPIATRILVNFFRAARNLVVDAIPAFRLLLRYVEGYSARARDASRNSRGIRDFFIDGVRYAKSFFDLGLAVVRLLLTISGRGGAAAEGQRTIQDLTDTVDGLTRKVNNNSGAVRRFFADTREVAAQVLRVLAAVGQMLIDSFDPKSASAFADFLVLVMIPALGTVIQIMGAIVTAFHQLFSLPGFSAFAQFIATFLLLAQGMTIVRLAILDVIKIVPNFLRAMGLIRAGMTGLAAVTTGGWIVLGIMAAVGAVLLLDKQFHFLGPTLRWLKGAATDTWEAIRSGAQAVANWFSDVWSQGLLMWIRWPFEKLIALVPWSAVWNSIRSGARAVINFFSGDQTGAWGALSDVLLAPFRLMSGTIRIIFAVVRGLVTTFLDVIAGRFDSAGQALTTMFNSVLDTLAGAASSFLSIWQSVLDALGKIPKFGAPFREAADEVKGARDSIDKWRESLRGGRSDSEKANEENRRTRDRVARAADAYEEARKKQSGLRRGTDDYRDAVRRTNDRQRDLNAAVKNLASRSTDARSPVSTLRRNIGGLGTTSSNTAAAVIEDLNKALHGMGAKQIRVQIRPRRVQSFDEALGVPDLGHLPGGATGGVFSRAAGLGRRLWGGGVPNMYGGAADDHILMSPSGAPVAALSGTEGIVNRPQMGIINSALGFAQAMGGLPWGSLNDLWGSGMRHYQGGGGLQPAIRQLSNSLDRRFGLETTSGWRGNMPLGHPDYHNVGLAADIHGTPDAMARTVRYIMASGLYRRLLEGIHNPGLSVKNGRIVPASFWGQNTWSDHIDHIHLALRGAVGALRNIAGAGAIRAPRIIGPEGPTTDMARAVARRTTAAANRYLNRQQDRIGGGDPQAMGAQANVVAAFRRAARTTGANRTERLALWEAGIVESGLRNLNFGDRDSRGALQERTSIFGRAHALNPYASALRFLRDAISRRPWRGTPGMLAAAVQRPAAQYRGRYDANANRAMRYMQTGGPLAALAPFANAAMRQPVAATVSRTRNLLQRIERAFTHLTEDNGLLDQLATAVENITARANVALQRRQFRIGRGGARRAYMSPAQLAQANMQTLQTTRTGLIEQQDVLTTNLARAQEDLQIAQRSHNRRAIAAAQGAITNLRTRMEKNTAALAQNAQDQVEAQEAFQQALLQSVTDAADRQNNRIDRWSRTAKALGQKLDPNAVIGAQISNMQSQIGGLQGVLNRAVRTGNRDLATQVRDQIDELNVQIAEAVAQQFQNSIDAVNNEAQRNLGALDRAARRAQIGTTNFAALGDTLTGRQGVLGAQRAGLAGLLGQAQATGNIEQIENLSDQIDELDTSMAENTQAIRDNTDAAFNSRTEQINAAQSFSQSVFGNAQSFFQAFSERTGIDTMNQQLAALRSQGGGLAAQRGGLAGQLANLLGYSPGEAQNLGSLVGGDLVNYLTSISAGPVFDAIMARLDTTQQQSFKDLVTGLLDNASAVETNTKALQDLTGATSQTFSSSFWTAFRTAVFTGNRELLPQYAMTIPSADVGARVLRSGALVVHAGETVRPAVVNRNWQDGVGDTFNLNVTSPTQVLDPVDVNRQLAFLRRTSGR